MPELVCSPLAPYAAPASSLPGLSNGLDRRRDGDNHVRPLSALYDSGGRQCRAHRRQRGRWGGRCGVGWWESVRRGTEQPPPAARALEVRATTDMCEKIGLTHACPSGNPALLPPTHNARPPPNALVLALQYT